MPHDNHARRTDKGDYMCGVCNLEMNQKVRLGDTDEWHCVYEFVHPQKMTKVIDN